MWQCRIYIYFLVIFFFALFFLNPNPETHQPNHEQLELALYQLLNATKLWNMLALMYLKWNDKSTHNT